VIVSVELPANVYAAGPVALAVQAEHTGSVHVTLDGADAGELIAAGEGLFTGSLAIHGAIDNGSHAVEVIATQGPHEDSKPAVQRVDARAGHRGMVASRARGQPHEPRRLSRPTGDLIEVGQTVIGGVPRPTIRKRSAATGAELWPEGTITLDTREGAAVDVAVLPDGRMWVAMNVREPMQGQRPRIVLLDADGHATGIEARGHRRPRGPGARRRRGRGCFAVGLAGVMGDWDFAYWRIDATGEQTLGDTYDYVPADAKPHSFVDLASDVVIDGDVAWIVGMSKGTARRRTRPGPIPPRGPRADERPHRQARRSRESSPRGPWVAAKRALRRDAPSRGRARDRLRVRQDLLDVRIETSRYSVDGKRTWFENEAEQRPRLRQRRRARQSGAGARLGRGDAERQAARLRVRPQGRPARPGLFDHWYPGAGPSEALGIARDGFDRIFPVGYITVNGETEARVTRIHG
jgi:hypothetical protein